MTVLTLTDKQLQLLQQAVKTRLHVMIDAMDELEVQITHLLTKDPHGNHSKIMTNISELAGEKTMYSELLQHLNASKTTSDRIFVA